MTHQIKNVANGAVFDCSEKPVWIGGIWECGNIRITDATGTAYVPVSTAPVWPVLEPLDFYLAFTIAERQSIKTSTDPNVMEFWNTYERCERANKPINPNLPSVQRGLAYLAQPATASPPGAGILASADRIPQILAGIPQ